MSDLAQSELPMTSSLKPAHERYHAKPFFGSSHSWAFALLNELPLQARVLDIGSGSGVAAKHLRARGAHQLWAVEPDAQSSSATSELYIKIVPTLEQLGTQRFDAILLLDVLEHVSDPFAFLKQAVSYLDPAGTVFISVPNIAHWSVRFSLLFGRFRYVERGILDRTHLHFFDYLQFKRLLASSNLEVVSTSSSIEPAEFVLPELVWNNSLFGLLSRARLGLARTLPGLFAYQFLGQLRKVT